MSEDANVQYLDQKSYAAKYDRQPFRDILTEGVVTSGALEITELDTPGMGVKSAKGRALVQGDQSEWQGHYGIRNDASKNLTIAASDPTNPRKDRIIAQVYDSVDIGGAEDKWALEVLTGTPAPAPDPPALPADALDLAIVDVGAGVTEIVNANITDQRERIGFQNVSDKGWITAGETWTFSSVDDPTGVFTITGDVTTKYSSGMRIKMTNGGNTIYGIISKTPTYSEPNTTITFLHEIDPTDNLALYLMANSAITNPYYSTMKAPFGFPLDPDKWTVEVTDTTPREQVSPTEGTWYNLGSLAINIPIGVFNLEYSCVMYSYATSAGAVRMSITLSTANNSESDSQFTVYAGIYTGTSEAKGGYYPIYKRKNINLASKTTYYINMKAVQADTGKIQILNSLQPLIIRAACAYL